VYKKYGLVSCVLTVLLNVVVNVLVVVEILSTSTAPVKALIRLGSYWFLY